MRRIVLTGGPYSGKTTLVDRLAAEGHAVAPEAALQVIEALAAELGAGAAVAWRRAHPGRFQERVLALQLELEARAEARGAPVVVCDRGVLDGVAYCRHHGIAPPPALARAPGRERYAAVLVLETLTGFEPRAHTGRLDGHDESLALAARLTDVYREHGYDPIPLPEDSVVARLARVRALIRGMVR